MEKGCKTKKTATNWIGRIVVPHLSKLEYWNIVFWKSHLLSTVFLPSFLPLSESTVSPSSSPDTGVPSSVYVVLVIVIGFCVVLLIIWGAICVCNRTSDCWFGYADKLVLIYLLTLIKFDSFIYDAASDHYTECGHSSFFAVKHK